MPQVKLAGYGSCSVTRAGARSRRVFLCGSAEGGCCAAVRLCRLLWGVWRVCARDRPRVVLRCSRRSPPDPRPLLARPRAMKRSRGECGLGWLWYTPAYVRAVDAKSGHVGAAM